jgi:uncharacterized ubiquitin-like protein YukD
VGYLLTSSLNNIFYKLIEVKVAKQKILHSNVQLSMDRRLLLVISQKHYNSIRYDLQLQKYKIICLNYENFNELKKQGLEVEYAYSQEFFDEGVQSAKEVEYFSSSYKQSSIYYKLASRFIINYEIKLIKCARELSNILFEKYPSEVIYIPIYKSEMKIFSTFQECESIILYLLNLNQNISLLSTVDETNLNPTMSLRIVNGYPFPEFKDDGFKIHNHSELKGFVNSAIEDHKSISKNSIDYFEFSGSFGIKHSEIEDDRNITLSIRHFEKKRIDLSINQIRSFTSVIDLFEFMTINLLLEDLFCLESSLKNLMKNIHQIELAISQHAFPETALLLKVIKELGVENKIFLIPHKISVLDLDLWNFTDLDLIFVLERLPNKPEELQKNYEISNQISQVRVERSVNKWNGLNESKLFNVLIVEPAIFELCYPILPLKILFNIQSRLLGIKDKCSLIIKKRPIWGSESFSQNLSNSVNASISVRTLEHEALDSSISIFFSQNSTAMFEVINSGSLAILCLDLENPVPAEHYAQRGLMREPSEYCLVINIAYLSQYVSLLRGNPDFLKDLFDLQSSKLKKDFKSNEF